MLGSTPLCFFQFFAQFDYDLLKRSKRLNHHPMPQTGIKLREKELSSQEEQFCVLYSSDEQFFANGVQSYIEAFDPDLTKRGAYDRAKSAAYELLTKPQILKRIDALLELRELNDPYVDKQPEFLITQNADFRSKVRAIAEYNKLKQRIKEKVEHSGEVVNRMAATEVTIPYAPRPWAMGVPTENIIRALTTCIYSFCFNGSR